MLIVRSPPAICTPPLWFGSRPCLLRRGPAGDGSPSRNPTCSASSSKLQVVFVSTEVAPWSKTGGLGDVVSALPAALAARGHQVMTVSPRYADYPGIFDTGLLAPVEVGADTRPLGPPRPQPVARPALAQRPAAAGGDAGLPCTGSTDAGVKTAMGRSSSAGNTSAAGRGLPMPTPHQLGSSTSPTSSTPRTAAATAQTDTDTGNGCVFRTPGRARAPNHQQQEAGVSEGLQGGRRQHQQVPSVPRPPPATEVTYARFYACQDRGVLRVFVDHPVFRAGGDAAGSGQQGGTQLGRSVPRQEREGQPKLQHHPQRPEATNQFSGNGSSSGPGQQWHVSGDPVVAALRSPQHGDPSVGVYTYSEGLSHTDLQARNSVLCQAALAAPVLLWHDMNAMPQELQDDLADLDAASSVPYHALPFVLRNGLAEPAITLEPGGAERLREALRIRLRARTVASRGGRSGSPGVSSPTPSSVVEASSSSARASLGVAGAYGSEAAAADGWARAGRGMAAPGELGQQQQVLFVGNDWPSALLPLWLQSYQEVATSASHWRSLLEARLQQLRAQMPSVVDGLQSRAGSISAPQSSEEEAEEGSAAAAGVREETTAGSGSGHLGMEAAAPMVAAAGPTGREVRDAGTLFGGADDEEVAAAAAACAAAAQLSATATQAEAAAAEGLLVGAQSSGPASAANAAWLSPPARGLPSAANVNPPPQAFAADSGGELRCAASSSTVATVVLAPPPAPTPTHREYDKDVSAHGTLYSDDARGGGFVSVSDHSNSSGSSGSTGHSSGTGSTGDSSGTGSAGDSSGTGSTGDSDCNGDEGHGGVASNDNAGARPLEPVEWSAAAQPLQPLPPPQAPSQPPPQAPTLPLGMPLRSSASDTSDLGADLPALLKVEQVRQEVLLLQLLYSLPGIGTAAGDEMTDTPGRARALAGPGDLVSQASGDMEDSDTEEATGAEDTGTSALTVADQEQQQQFSSSAAAAAESQDRMRGTLNSFRRFVASRLRGAKVVLAVHNFAFQGLFSEESFWRLGLPLVALQQMMLGAGGPVGASPPPPASSDSLAAGAAADEPSDPPAVSRQSDGAGASRPGTGGPGRFVSWLKAALLSSDLLVTVSPGYARELVEGPKDGPAQPASQAQRVAEGAPQADGPGLPAGARELCDIVATRGMQGIMNGLDEALWDPANDPLLSPNVRYSRETAREGKARAKAQLQAQLGLEVDPDVPLFGFVGRLEQQKGVDVILAALPKLLGPTAGNGGYNRSLGYDREAVVSAALQAQQEAAARKKPARLLQLLLSGLYKPKWPPLPPSARAASASAPTAVENGEAEALAATVGGEPSAADATAAAATGAVVEASGDGSAVRSTDAGMQLVMLGTGEQWLKDGLAALPRAYPRRAAGIVSFDEPLCHLLLAGCDYLLVPSRWEPCGLVALAALRYGTVPLVAPTGGLLDAVTPVADPPSAATASRKGRGDGKAKGPQAATADDSLRVPGASSTPVGRDAASGGGREGLDGDSRGVEQVEAAPAGGGLLGFVMDRPVGQHDDSMAKRAAVESLVRAVRAACGTYGTETFQALRERCMAQDVSWSGPAQRWEQLLLDVAAGGQDEVRGGGFAEVEAAEE